MEECSLCHRELPDSEFYPSTLRKGLRHCKKCCYERWGKKNVKKYTESIKELPEQDLNRYYGGYSISIINFVRKGEYKYIIKGTDGVLVQTNDVQTFKTKLNEILDKME
jgi:hypothetical protein